MVDCVYEDMDSLLNGLVSTVDRESREDTREFADKPLQDENVRFDDKILALFQCRE